MLAQTRTDTRPVTVAEREAFFGLLGQMGFDHRDVTEVRFAAAPSGVSVHVEKIVRDSTGRVVRAG
jgi:hypothetical protein